MDKPEACIKEPKPMSYAEKSKIMFKDFNEKLKRKNVKIKKQ
jgi:hypothetical protein